MPTAITGSLPIEDYTPLGIVHGHAETLDPAPASAVAAAAIQALTAHAATLGADLVINVHTTITNHGLEGTRVLATGTAITIRYDRLRPQYAHLLNA